MSVNFSQNDDLLSDVTILDGPNLISFTDQKRAVLNQTNTDNLNQQLIEKINKDDWDNVFNTFEKDR
jgi:hypothetical protein